MMRYRAFLSSTYEDLKEHRAFVIRTLRSAGFDVDPMEDWTSAPGEPRDVSLDRIAEGDFLVLLVALRRGHIPEGQSRSITQLEYGHAIEKGMEVLPFLLEENADWPAEWNDLERDPELRQWREELKSRHIVKFFGARPDSTELAASLTRWVQERHSRLVPHQLPRPPEDFTGRDREIDNLVQSIFQGGVSISGIRGLGGVGKTSLALAVAQRVTRLFRDGQIYLDLKGTTEPLSPMAAMLHVIRSLESEPLAPDDEAEIQGLYRSVLSGKRLLILMDNAAEREQVQPLIPPEPSVMLVTSRQHFVLPGFSAHNLGELTLEESEALLISIAPRVGGEAQRIAELCGGLPLALRLAGNALATRPDLSPSDYAQRLAYQRERIPYLDRSDESHGVSASLSLSYRMLNRELQRCVSMLAIFPADFALAAVARVWGVDEDAAGDRLGEFLGRSLLQWNEDRAGAGRYKMHDLVRLFASQQLDDRDREMASRCHAEHYLGVLDEAARQYRIGGEGVTHGLGLFDREGENIQAGFQWCKAEAQENDDAAVLCSQYFARGADVLQLRQHRDDRIDWLQSGLENAIRVEDRPTEAALLGHLGIAYGNIGELNRAIEFHERSLAIVRELGDRHGEGITLENLGEAHWRSGQQREAIQHYERSLEIGRETRDQRRESNSLLNMALAHWQLGEPHRAIEVAERCLEVAREIGDRQKEGQSLGIMGLALRDLGEPRRCIELSTSYLEIARDMNDRFSEGTALLMIGSAYRELDEFPRSVKCLEEALEILRSIGDRFFEGEACWELGLTFEKAGELERAQASMEVRLDYRRQTGHPGAEDDAARLRAVEARLADG